MKTGAVPYVSLNKFSGVGSKTCTVSLDLHETGSPGTKIPLDGTELILLF